MARTVEDLLAENNDLLRRVISSGGGGTGGSGAGGSGGSFSNLTPVIRNTTTMFGKLTLGGATAADALNFAGDSAARFAHGFPMLNATISGLTKFGTAIISVNDQLNEMNRSGISYNNNIGQFIESATGAATSVNKWQEILTKNSDSVARMGMTANQGAMAFGNMANVFQQQGVTEQLKTLGESSDSLNDTLMLSASLKRNADMNDLQVRAQTIQSALSLATQFDDLARITGKSKEKQKADLEQEARKAEVRAMTYKMDAKESAEYLKTIGLVQTTLGQTAANALEEIRLYGGAKSKEAQQVLTGLGPENMMEIARLSKEKEKASTEDEKKRIQDQMDIVLDRANKHLMENAQPMLMSDQLKGTISKLVSETTLDRATGIVEARQKAEAERAKAFTAPEEGAKAGIAINTASIKLQELSGEFGKAANQINTGFGPAFGHFTRELNAFHPSGTVDQLRQWLQEHTSSNQPRVQRDQGGNLTPPVHREQGSPGIQSFLSGSGSFMNMFEDFGKKTAAELHGTELVARPEQLAAISQKIGQQMSASNMPQAIQGMLSALPKEMTAAATNRLPQIPPMPQIPTIPMPTPTMPHSPDMSMFKEIFDKLNQSLERLNATSQAMLEKADQQITIAKKSQKTFSGNRLG